MATVDDLSVKVSAKTADFQAGMQSAQAGLSGLRNDAMETAASMQVLQGRMDEAGDEAQTAGAKAGASSSGFLALAGAAATTQISFDSLSVVTTASLIPAILTLSTVMAPLLAAMGGFVAVAGSIVGVGLIGFLGAATQRSDQLKSNFQELKSTVLNQLAPVFDIFAGVLNRLMVHLTDTISEISVSEGVIRRIAGQFEQLGVSIINTLPAFVDMAVTLTDRFLPPFVDLAQNVLPKLPGYFMSLVPVMQEVGATLRPLAAAISDLRPQITQFGMVVLNTIVPALTTLVNWFGNVLTSFRQLDTGTQKLIAKIAILAPVVSGLAQLFGGPLMVALGGLVTTISGPLLTGLLTITGAFTSLVGVITTLAPSLIGLGGTLSAMSPTLAGLIGVVTSATATFGSFSAVIATVSGTLTSIAVTLSAMSPALAGIIGSVITASTTFSSFLIPLGAVLTTFGSLLTTLTATLGPIGLLIGSIGALGYALKQNRQVITRFANHAITKLQNSIRHAATWIQANGPRLIGNAFRAIGEGIRFIVLDIYNAVTGNGDSILKSIVLDFGTWLVTNGPGILKSAAKTAFDVIMAAARGLYRGLIGNSLFPEMFRDIASYIRTTGKQLISGAIDAVVQSAKSAFNYLTGTGGNTLYGDVTSGLQSIANWIRSTGKSSISGAVDTVVGSVETAANYLTGTGSGTLYGEATGSIEDIASWIRDFDITSPIVSMFSDAGSAASSAFKEAFNTAIPNSVDIPSTTIAGKTVGGGSFSLPSLDTGGYIEEDGIYKGHEGERVLNPAETRQLQEYDGGGGGGDTFNIEVDARGADDPHQVRRNAERGLSSALEARNVRR